MMLIRKMIRETRNQTARIAGHLSQSQLQFLHQPSHPIPAHHLQRVLQEPLRELICHPRVQQRAALSQSPG